MEKLPDNIECWKFNTLHLHVDTINSMPVIVVDKCCFKTFDRNSFIKYYTFEEFLSLKNIYEELDSIKNVYPESFNKAADFRCPVPVCDFSKFDCKKLIGIDVAMETHCNARCRFCTIEEKINHDLKQTECFNQLKDIYFKTLYDLKGHNLDYIRLTDTGEPFFFKNDTLSYLKTLTKEDAQFINFNSNFIGIQPNELESLISEMKIPIQPVVSLNGWDEESHKKLMGVSSSMFDRVMKNILMLHKLNVDYQVSFVIDEPESVAHVADFVKKNMYLFKMGVIVNPDSRRNPNELLPEINKYFEIDPKSGFLKFPRYSPLE